MMMHRKATASCTNPGAALPNKQETMLTVTDDSQPDFKSLAVLFVPQRKNQPKNQLKVKINTQNKKCGALILLREKRIEMQLRRRTGAIY